MAEPIDIAQFKIKQNKEAIKQRDAAFIKRATWIAARRPWLKDGIGAVVAAWEYLAAVNQQMAEQPRYLDHLVTPRIKCITEDGKGKARFMLNNDNMRGNDGRPGGGYALLTFGEYTGPLEFPQELHPHAISILTTMVERRGAQYGLEMKWLPLVVIRLFLDRLHEAGFRIGDGWRITKQGRVTLNLKSRRETVRVEIDFKALQQAREHWFESYT